MPYLRIFDAEAKVREIELTQPRIVIGRDVPDGIKLADPTVSRIHAIIHRRGNRHYIEDASSRGGTFIAGVRIGQKPLQHGDTFSISTFVLEYRTDDAERHASLVNPDDSAIDQMLRLNFRHLPTSIRLRFRILSIEPADVFAPGDTLRVGDGGILITTRQPLSVNLCIEVELTAPNAKPQTFMGEVLGSLDSLQMPSMCVKLHDIGEEGYQKAMKYARRGSWQNAEKPA